MGGGGGALHTALRSVRFLTSFISFYFEILSYLTCGEKIIELVSQNSVKLGEKSTSDFYSFWHASWETFPVRALNIFGKLEKGACFEKTNCLENNLSQFYKGNILTTHARNYFLISRVTMQLHILISSIKKKLHYFLIWGALKSYQISANLNRREWLKEFCWQSLLKSLTIFSLNKKKRAAVRVWLYHSNSSPLFLG